MFTDWQQFVKDKLRTWRLSNLDWLWNFTGPTHIILYEELVSHLERTLRSLIHFLELPLDEEELRCALLRREGIYKRKPRTVSLDPFTPNMKASLKTEQDFVYKEIQIYLKSAWRKDSSLVHSKNCSFHWRSKRTVLGL